MRLPVPGPISRTVSVGRIADLSMIDLTIRGFFRMCWPLDLSNSRGWNLAASFINLRIY